MNPREKELAAKSNIKRIEKDNIKLKRMEMRLHKLEKLVEKLLVKRK